MLRKIISVKNVGRFLNSATAGNPELSRYTFIQGANGFGKTTLCAILRSLKSGNPDYISGRRTLGLQEQPIVELLFSDQRTARFDKTTWNITYPELAIFDFMFVSENVHSGETVEIDHRRNLFNVIIGEEGVRLGKENANLAKKSRQKTGKITAIGETIKAHIPEGTTLDDFLALPDDPQIDNLIAEQKQLVEAVRQEQQIRNHPSISEIRIPDFPEGFDALLACTIDDIAQDAETLLAEHLTVHGMEENGSNWIAEGLEHATQETCPFCDQDIQGLSLIAAYRTVFSDQYKNLRRDIANMRSPIADQFGERFIGQLSTQMEQNKGRVVFWNQFCEFDVNQLVISDDVSEAIRNFRETALSLLKSKELNILESIHPDAAFNSALTKYKFAHCNVEQINEVIRTVNGLIAAQKEAIGTANAHKVEAELNRLKAIKVRHAEPVAKLCAKYVKLINKKGAIDRRKNEVRDKLDIHTMEVIRPYEQRINHYLDVFNAGFRITETNLSYPGGFATSSYRLVINNTTFKLGDGQAPLNRPSFHNTLSSGDRTTLAFAFFLAHLEGDQNLANQTVVFDDPFCSQDAFRRRQTVHEITKIGQICKQVIVLSHDSTFLKQIWDKVPASERIALTLADHRKRGNKIMCMNLPRACSGRTANDIDDLQAYLNFGNGERVDLIRKIRVVLETHFWTTYPACFLANHDKLGDIVRKIREGGSQHPAYDLYDELDQINSYTKEYHHGENVGNPTPDSIDPQELTGYVKRTFKIVNALQA